MKWYTCLMFCKCIKDDNNDDRMEQKEITSKSWATENDDGEEEEDSKMHLHTHTHTHKKFSMRVVQGFSTSSQNNFPSNFLYDKMKAIFRLEWRCFGKSAKGWNAFERDLQA